MVWVSGVVCLCRREWLSAALIVLCVTGLAGPVAAQCLTTALVNGDSLPFGSAIDVDGDRMVVGDWGLFGTGGAFVLRRAPFGWDVVQQLGPWGGVPGAVHFGAAVALSDDLVLAGAPTEGGAAGASCGAAYLFVDSDSTAETPYLLEQRLVSPVPSAHAGFGNALTLDGDTAAIGEPGSDLAASNAGAVHLYERVGDDFLWQATLLPEPASAGASFGAALALVGDTLAVGAPGQSAAYVFQRVGDTWSFEARLAPPEAGSYGAAVALHGERLLVGAPESSLTAIKSGGAWLHRREAAPSPPATPGSANWPVEAVLQASDAFFFHRFGASVALDGDVAVAGATGAENSKGAVYHFRRSLVGAWPQVGKFAALPGPAHSGLGVSAALDGDVLAFGAVTAFGLPGVTFVAGGLQPWETLGGGIAGALGEPLLTAQGTLCGGTQITLTASQLPAGAPMLFCLGTSAINLPFKGGVFVPWPEVMLGSFAGSSGAAVVSGTWPPGQPGQQHVLAQAWILDASAPHGLSATDALRATTP
ncbi:MAG: FG-GAP repeat protein [Planctomycetota bacterium]